MMAAALAVTSRLLSGTRVVWHCDPRGDRPRIYFGNHSSHLDFVLIWSSLPGPLRRFARPVAGRDYWEKGPVRRYLAGHMFHAVLVDRSRHDCRGDAASASRSIERMANEIDAGHSLIVFPEGTRAPDAEVGPFKSGLFHLAQVRPDVELVPVYLDNLNRILPKGEFLPVPMLSRVVFGRPLEGIAREDKPAFLARARAALTELRSFS